MSSFIEDLNIFFLVADILYLDRKTLKIKKNVSDDHWLINKDVVKHCNTVKKKLRTDYTANTCSP